MLLIALLAVARKFIILDMRETSAEYLLALAAITLALGVTYRLMRFGADPIDRLGGNRRATASGGERESGIHHPGKDEIDAEQ
ncbi:MAG TPA: phosphate-starvation-inducible PsiE family protein [Rhizomicrobium sp.]|nr:phosphate-starvation-inducible PsiE family protein [Rhizomicrobium sp.]